MPLTLCAFGHVARTWELLAAVRQDSIVDIYQISPAIYRVRRGLYACGHLAPAEKAALACGGPLDCLSALHAAGLPLGTTGAVPDEVHVRLRPGDKRAAERCRAFAGDPAAGFRPIAHWSRLRLRLPEIVEARVAVAQHREPPTRARTPLLEAFRQALVCAPLEALTALEAARGDLLAPDTAAMLLAAAPQRVIRLWDRRFARRDNH